MSVIGVFSIKGGVGKTATAVNLAYLASRGRDRVLLWDLDPQAASSFYFRVEAEQRGGIKALLGKALRVEDRIRGTDYERLDLLFADESYRKLDLVLAGLKRPKHGLERVLDAVAPAYRHIFLDCPPGLTLTAENVLHASDVVLVPVIPTPLSRRTLAQLEQFCRRKGIEVELVPFFCMVDRRKHLHLELMAELEAEGHHFLTATIPYASAIEQMGVRRAPLATYAAASPGAEAYDALWLELRRKLGPR